MKPTGNLLLNRMAGSTVGVMPAIPPGQRFNVYDRMLEDVSTKLKLDIPSCVRRHCTWILYRAQGKIPYSMTLGGANIAGCWGYIEFFKEIIEQV